MNANKATLKAMDLGKEHGIAAANLWISDHVWPATGNSAYVTTYVSEVVIHNQYPHLQLSGYPQPEPLDNGEFLRLGEKAQIVCEDLCRAYDKAFDLAVQATVLQKCK